MEKNGAALGRVLSYVEAIVRASGGYVGGYVANEPGWVSVRTEGLKLIVSFSAMSSDGSAEDPVSWTLTPEELATSRPAKARHETA